MNNIKIKNINKKKLLQMEFLINKFIFINKIKVNIQNIYFKQGIFH